MVKQDFNRKFGPYEDRPSIPAAFNRRAAGQIDSMYRRVILKVFEGNPDILFTDMTALIEILHALPAFHPADQNIHRHPHT